ncbi:MAG: ABC transporter permease [Oscillospiraceae bacterium]|jgi:ABC-2 type transport system permease protein|nr:ABC transporter permease [Oscillospiraceae bacterium]
MFAVLKRELSAYFSSPIGYIYLAVFYVFSGYFFFGVLYSNTTSLSNVFNGMFTIIMLLIPILTMRLMSEDLKNKTDQALLTAPISLLSLVLGKFLSALIVYCLGVAITLVYAIVIATFAPPDWTVVFGNVLGMLLLGAALIAIGMFISALTENQVIAAVGGFAVGFSLILVNSLASLISTEWLKKFVSGLSFMERYDEFTNGILDISNIFFFISICAVFVFFTVRVFEKRRWS